MKITLNESVIEEFLDKYNLTKRQLAKDLGVCEYFLNCVVHNKKQASLDVYCELAKITNIPYEDLVNLEFDESDTPTDIILAKSGITSKKLAKLIGVHPETICRILHKQRKCSIPLKNAINGYLVEPIDDYILISDFYNEDKSYKRYEKFLNK